MLNSERFKSCKKVHRLTRNNRLNGGFIDNSCKHKVQILETNEVVCCGTCEDYEAKGEHDEVPSGDRGNCCKNCGHLY